MPDVTAKQNHLCIFIIISIVIYSSKYNPNFRKARYRAVKKGNTKKPALGCCNGAIAEV